MKTSPKAKREKAFGKWWCVMFLHSEGWTVTEVFSGKLRALKQMHKDKEMFPLFKHKVLPCTITYHLPSKKRGGKAKI